MFCVRQHLLPRRCWEVPYLCHEVEFIYLGKMYGTGLNLHECTVLAKAAGSLNPQCLPWLHRSFLTDQAGHRHCSHECKFKPSYM